MQLSPKHEPQEQVEDWRQLQKMQALQTLSVSLAHDYNNMLAVIIGNLDFAKEQIPPNSQLLHFIKPAIQASEKMAELNKRLMAFGSKQALRPHKQPLNDIITFFASSLKAALGEHIEIEIFLTREAGVVLIDQQLLEQTLLDLAHNARDAMPSGGKLLIETRSHNTDTALLCISDTGCGMGIAELDKAFEPFFTTKGFERGKGMGLSTVYGFIKQSGGSISLTSVPDKGTTVSIYLPKAKSPHLTG